jgi:hypothetical protein
MNPWLEWHFHPDTGPKRILALDGGGVRGLVTLGMLEHIERILATRNANPEGFCLAHYFDLIAGTSTGSIIATALALGMKVSEIKSFYEELSPIAFRPRAKGFFKPVYDAGPIEEKLKAILGDEQLQSDKLITGLMICAKRIDTGSPWVLTNNPKSAYWDKTKPDQRFHPNKEYFLRAVVRASTAAPLYFDPVEAVITPKSDYYEEERGVFIDGGVGGHNNPSLQALMVATLPAYGFNWRKGAENLHIVSVGTGSWRARHKVDDYKRWYNWQKAADALAAMIQDTVQHAITTLQTLSEPRKPWYINSEVGDLKGQMIVDRAILSFQRYDARIEAEHVARVCNIQDPSSRRVKFMMEELRQIGNIEPANLKRLYALGEDVRIVRRSERRELETVGIEPDDFPRCFDPPFMQFHSEV